MIDLNEFYAQWREDQEKTKFEMVITAAKELFRAVQEKYYDAQDLKNLKICHFAETCGWCGWPDFQDGGIFEQAIKAAANMVLEALDIHKKW